MGVIFDEEQEPFLEEPSSHSNVPALEQDPYNRQPRSWDRLRVVLVFTLTLSLMLNAYFIMGRVITTHTQKYPFSPADRHKMYNVTNVKTRNYSSPYVGPPREEFDRAWSELLAGTSIQVTADELRQVGRKSLKLREQEGYLGSLEVYHQLHCVKRMVQSRYPENYPSLVDHGQLSSAHFDHCVEVLRKGIMCSADTTLNTVAWDGPSLTHMKGVTDGPRKCADWDHLERWVQSRIVAPGHPVLSVDEPGFMGPDF